MSLVPPVSGIYAWWFSETPAGLAAEGCRKLESGQTLLYVGIAPARAPDDARRRSHLRRRIRSHYSGNIRGSTLRYSLAALLFEHLGLAAVSRTDGRPQLADESALDDWMSENAFVTFVEQHAPWEIEAAVVTALRAPLNMAHNALHPDYALLSAARRRLRNPD